MQNPECQANKRKTTHRIAIRDTYTVEVAGGEDDALILALTVVVEQMCQD